MILSACQGPRLNCATGLDGVGSHVCSSASTNIHDKDSAESTVNPNVSEVSSFRANGDAACVHCLHQFVVFHFPNSLSPLPGPVIAAVKADRKSESQLRTTSQPHATCAAVQRSRLPASRLYALKNAATDLGAASLTKVDRPVLASD